MTIGTRRPRVLVIGLGGIGGTITATLLERGVEVAPVTTNAEIARAIERDGYVLTEGGQTRSVRGPVHREPPADLAPFDLVLLATQPPDAEEAALRALPVLSSDGAIVCFQNGLIEDRIAPIAGEGRVIGAIVAWGGSILGPGRYERTSSGGFTIGRISGVEDERLRDLSVILENVGPVEISRNLRGARWSKLAINCAISALGTVGGERLGVLLAQRHVRRLALEIMTETVEVARLEAVRLEKVSGTFDLEWLALTADDKRSVGSPSLVAKHAMLLAVGARYRRLRSSMLAAIERGKKPSVDFLNGEVVRFAQKHGTSASLNERLQRTVHQIARRELSPSQDLLRRIYEETRHIDRTIA